MASRAAQTVKTGVILSVAIAFVFASFVVILGVATDYFFPQKLHTTAANYDELRETSLFKGRWLPEHMPKSVRDLQGWNDLDSDKAEVEFFIDSNELDYLTQEYNELATERRPSEYSTALPDGSPQFRCFEFIEEDTSGDYVRFIAFEVATRRVIYRGRPERMNQ